MEVVSSEGRGLHTRYLVREGDREWTVTGAKNLPKDVFDRWRNRQSSECMRRARDKLRERRIQQPKEPSGNSEPQEIELQETRASQEAGPSTGRQQVVVESDEQRALRMITCKICQDRQVQRLIIPCGHLILCAECLSIEMSLRKVCPVCRVQIRDHFGVNW